VRYHRRALPDVKHDHFAALEPEERVLVEQLSAFLRVADGLDRTHRSVVKDISCRYSDRKIILQCASRLPAPEEEKSARQKGDLLEKVYQRKLVIRWRSML
jgi:exopolyphosphatase/pppGpp-phosphohydrolase